MGTEKSHEVWAFIGNVLNCVYMNFEVEYSENSIENVYEMA